jgi:hypothetical protein
MENAVELNVPLQVKLSYGETWGSLQPLELQIDSNSLNLQEDLQEGFSLRSRPPPPLTAAATHKSLQPIARCIFEKD